MSFCLPVSVSLQVQERAGSACYWTGLQWRFSVCGGQSRLRLTVHSGRRLLGAALYSLTDLLAAPTHQEDDDTGYRRLQREVLGGDGEVVGQVKVAFLLQLLPGRTPLPHPLGATTSPTTSSPHQLALLSAAASVADGAWEDGDDLLLDHHGGPGLPHGSLRGASASLASNYLAPPPPTVRLPCSFRLDEVLALELFPVHSLARNLPSVRVTCGNFYQATQVGGG